MKVKEKKAGGLRERWAAMPFFSGEELGKLDLIVTVLLLLFLYVTCVQGDLRTTGNRSFLMYRHFLDFYKASYEQSGGYWANYLPSTFLAFAIWNLPLYLTGHVPEAILTNSFVNIMWYKLLPVTLYAASAFLIGKICLEAGFGERKARLCRYAFLVFPVAVFSQFIFSQYDIFTVFFMMLGLYFYFKGGMWRFALCFGVATTFKYHAVLYFLVFLLLREKKLRNLIRYSVLMAVPVLAEVLPNIGSVHFRRHVFGFGALKFVQKPFQLGFFGGINLVAAVAAFVLVWAYQRRARGNEELYSWGMFLSVAVSFSIFGFSSWNPQWLLIMVPFLVMNIFINENGNMLVMVTNIFTVALYIFCSQNIVGEDVLNHGILKYILPDTQFSLRMWDVYRFHNEELLCTAMWVVLLIYVVFGHPRYHTRRGDAVSKGLLWQIRCAFLVGVFAWVIPLGFCVQAALAGGTVFFDNSRNELETDNIAAVNADSTVRQEIRADGDTLSDIKIRVCTEDQGELAPLHVTLSEKESGQIVYEGERTTEGLAKNSSLYSFLKGPVKVKKGGVYVLEIASGDETGTAFYCVSAEGKKELLDETDGSGEAGNRRLQMRVTGMVR